MKSRVRHNGHLLQRNKITAEVGSQLRQQPPSPVGLEGAAVPSPSPKRPRWYGLGPMLLGQTVPGATRRTSGLDSPGFPLRRALGSSVLATAAIALTAALNAPPRAALAPTGLARAALGCRDSMVRHPELAWVTLRRGTRRRRQHTYTPGVCKYVSSANMLVLQIC